MYSTQSGRIFRAQNFRTSRFKLWIRRGSYSNQDGIRVAHFLANSIALSVKQMPEKETLRRAHEDEAEGKSPSVQAGEFVREEIHHRREGKHGARSAKQAVAIGLSKARRAGVKLPPPDPDRTSKSTRQKAKADSEQGRHPHKPSKKRSRATMNALKREGRQAASSKALSRQTKSSAAKRSKKDRSAPAKKAARTRAARS